MSDAAISWISGPVLRARGAASFQLNEAVMVGTSRLPGEVLRLDGSEIVVQVYEDTDGLRPGDPVYRSGAPLSVILGPWLLGNIFDGLLRPLAASGRFLEPGQARPAEDELPFSPLVAIGQRVEEGQAWARVGAAGGRQQDLRLPPGLSGNVVNMAEEGIRAADEQLCFIDSDSGSKQGLSMAERWPVRDPRPVRRRLPADEPMITGQRILDTLFPLARGSRAALPGGFGTGKTALQQALAKFSDVDIVVYVGCGERGNEMAEVLTEFPELADPRGEGSLLERTVIIANTSNMPVAAREASIYTGVTVAEYFRDQGYDVALMADSTSRWAEALRELSGRLEELPGEGGYPAYLSSRLAQFYERAGRVETLGGDTGSITLIGAVSPPGGDFSEPVTKHTQRYVRCLWSLDPQLAQARRYPAVNPLKSYSRDVANLQHWWQSRVHASWAEQRLRLLELLDQKAQLERMARIVGKDSLPQRQRLRLLCAELADDAFLRQSALSPVDGYCSPQRQAAMLSLVLRFVDLAFAAMDRGRRVAEIAALPILRRLQRMGEDLGEEQLHGYEVLAKDLEQAFVVREQEASDAR